MPQTEFAGHVFSDEGLLAQALTHSSAGGSDNERLEFLGDGLVNLIIAEALFQRWERADEGELTRARAELVRERSLAAVARRLEVGPRIRFGPGERKSGAHRRDSILADTLEALIAAIYLDAGFEHCRVVVLQWFGDAIAALSKGQVGKDAKTRLQEWLQGRSLPLPAYELVDARGEEHDRLFVASCRVAGSQPETRGEGSSRRAAEQRAAESMLERLLEQQARGRQARTPD